jgi:hypothetical protein
LYPHGNRAAFTEIGIHVVEDDDINIKEQQREEEERRNSPSSCRMHLQLVFCKSNVISSNCVLSERKMRDGRDGIRFLRLHFHSVDDRRKFFFSLFIICSFRSSLISRSDGTKVKERKRERRENDIT